jgi:hypothetical protein
MTLAPVSPLRIPFVAICCAAVFALYGLWNTEQQTINCHRIDGRVQCQVHHSLLFERLPIFDSQFELLDVELHSTLCDNTPRGGVRFCHHLTLLAQDNRRYLLPEFRSPLSATTIRDDFRDFIQGQSELALSLPPASRSVNYLNIALVGLLLALVAWSFWDIRWPPQPVSPMALDGADEKQAL